MHDKHPKKVLVVDDEIHIVNVVAMKLRHAGYTVSTARDPHEAFEIAQKELPDLIITDSELTELTGIEAALHITQDHPIPVIIFSSRDAPPNHGGHDNDHIVEYLVKPIKLAELARAISKAADSLNPEQA